MKRKGILAWVLCVCTSGLCAQGRVSGNLLEELMEKLPGKVIVEDGTVKINGKQVERIIVDGKDTLSFFNQRICNDSTKHQGKMENLLKKIARCASTAGWYCTDTWERCKKDFD